MAQETTVHRPDLPTVLAEPSPAAPIFDPAVPAEQELERQLQVYLDLGFPELLGMDESGFRALVEPLRSALPATDAPTSVPPEDHLPFVVVLGLERPNDAVPAMPRHRRWGERLRDVSLSRLMTQADACAASPA